MDSDELAIVMEECPYTDYPVFVTEKLNDFLWRLSNEDNPPAWPDTPILALVAQQYHYSGAPPDGAGEFHAKYAGRRVTIAIDTIQKCIVAWFRVEKAPVVMNVAMDGETTFHRSPPWEEITASHTIH